MGRISSFTDPDIRKEVVSLVVKLSSGWRQSQQDVETIAGIEGTWPLLARFSNMVSFLGKIVRIWRQPHNDGSGKMNIEETFPIMETYNITQDLCLIWAVDIVVQDSHCIQVLKIWDILPPTETEELKKVLVKKVYGKYTENMMSRCKEKYVDGYVELQSFFYVQTDL